MTTQSIKEVIDKRPPVTTEPTVSVVLRDGTMIETVYDPEARRTAFAVSKNGAWDYADNYALDPVRRLVPYSAGNNLIKEEIVLLPSAPEEYGSEAELIADIKAFIHRHVDVSPLYEDIATYYVLFSWLYDGFNELPYLRVRGDPGTGKTRFLLTVGSLCYKPIFASGASTVSPLFRLLEIFRGTLVIDESDFRFSDEKAEMVKILNNGNVRGFPVLRSETNNKGEFNPRAYNVFGPKILASRGEFEDRALESRFLTEEMGGNRLRTDVPINLPAEHRLEALRLRNRLLCFRFKNYGRRLPSAALADAALEPRLNQIFVPLFSVIDDPEAQAQLREVARQRQRDIVAERGLDTEAQVLEAIQELLALAGDRPISIKEITARFTELHADDYDRRITARWVGSIVRKRLHLKAQKVRGVYVLVPEERGRIERLFERYGLTV